MEILLSLVMFASSEDVPYYTLMKLFDTNPPGYCQMITLNSDIQVVFINDRLIIYTYII